MRDGRLLRGQRTRVTLVGVLAHVVLTLGELQSGTGNDLVEGEGTTAHLLAGTAVATRGYMSA